MHDSPTHRVLVSNLRARMKAVGVSVEQMSDLAAVSRAQSYRVLGYECNPSLRWIERVSAALDTTPGELLTPPGRLWGHHR